MRTLAHPGLLGNDLSLCLWNDVSQIIVELRQLQRAISPDRVHLAIIIEQHGKIVQRPANGAALPRSGRVLRREHLRSVLVDVAEYIKRAVVITERWSPQSLAVNIPAAFQTELRPQIEFIRRVGND